MKLHRNLLQAVIEGLRAVLLQQQPADVVVDQLLSSNKNWGSRDRHFIADHIYSIIRYRRLYEYCAQISLVDESSLWTLLGTKLMIEKWDLTGWAEFQTLQLEETLGRHFEAQSVRKIRESVPDWLDELGEKELGKQWDDELMALNVKAQFSIRVNTIKTNKEVIKRLFTDDQIEFAESPDAPNALILKQRKNFRNYAAYKNGLFEIQDVSSQMVAPLLEPEAGMMVIDGCAGAGGKTLHVAALMKNRGEILAIDVSEKKLEQLQLRATRAGALIIQTLTTGQLTTGAQTKLRSAADRLLLDVPCSGLGVLRRKPDAKWSLSEAFIRTLIATQEMILEEYTPMLKPGGLLVYSTCSILPSENEKQVEKFLHRQAGKFELLQEVKLSPSQTGFDGFYIAKLRKLA